jgi:hypothetical protein
VISGSPNRQKAALTAGRNYPRRTPINPKSLMIKRLVVLTVGTLAIAAPAANAQRSQGGSTPIELGIDGAIYFGLDSPRATALVLPLQDFRIGFLVSDRIELEPRFNLTSVHTGGVSTTDYTFELGVLYQPAGDRVGRACTAVPLSG